MKVEGASIRDPKQRGGWAEMRFMIRAAEEGFRVSKPWGDSERYDFVIDSGYNFWRVQVKSTQRFANWRYQVKTAGWKSAYTKREIDFLIAYISPENVWYIVPIAATVSHQHLRFYPNGKGHNSRLEKYREAWCQLACPRDEDGRSRVLVHRQCQRVGSANCPVSEKGSRRRESRRDSRSRLSSRAKPDGESSKPLHNLSS